MGEVQWISSRTSILLGQWHWQHGDSDGHDQGARRAKGLSRVVALLGSSVTTRRSFRVSSSRAACCPGLCSGLCSSIWSSVCQRRRRRRWRSCRRRRWRSCRRRRWCSCRRRPCGRRLRRAHAHRRRCRRDRRRRLGPAGGISRRGHLQSVTDRLMPTLEIVTVKDERRLASGRLQHDASTGDRFDLQALEQQAAMRWLRGVLARLEPLQRMRREHEKASSIVGPEARALWHLGEKA